MHLFNIYYLLFNKEKFPKFQIKCARYIVQNIPTLLSQKAMSLQWSRTILLWIRDKEKTSIWCFIPIFFLKSMISQSITGPNFVLALCARKRAKKIRSVVWWCCSLTLICWWIFRSFAKLKIYIKIYSLILQFILEKY